MRLHKHFSEQDLAQADKHYNCFKDCLEIVHHHVERGEMELAKQRGIDMMLSLQELCKLADRKRAEDRMNTLMEHIKANGIHVEAVRRMIHE